MSLSTHVLDLANGRPAASVVIRLLRLTGQDAALLVERTTDADGRARLGEGSDLTAGAYRLAFDIGPYFRDAGSSAVEPGFLETVVIDFNMLDPQAHLHVPLLVSPFGYSTYRGS
jgi:5-hydroxyisourate hydrolase